MLTYLKINNFALIEESEVEFTGGFTVVTGESGAGKSIMMSAVEILCGGRGGREAIRTGCDKAVISGIFTISNGVRKELSALFSEYGLEWEEDKQELTLRRVIGKTTTRNFIDDVPVSTRVLQNVGSYLVDLHGANEQLSLMVPARQLELLDNSAGLSDLCNGCREICGELTKLSEMQAEFDAGLPDASEADRLQLMVEEIERFNPQPGEDELLYARQRRGANARKILESAGLLADLLTEREDSIADRLGEVYRTLCDLERIDPALTDDLSARCAELQTAVSELSA